MCMHAHVSLQTGLLEEQFWALNHGAHYPRNTRIQMGEEQTLISVPGIWGIWIWGSRFAGMEWVILKMSSIEEEPQNGDVS